MTSPGKWGDDELQKWQVHITLKCATNGSLANYLWAFLSVWSSSYSLWRQIEMGYTWRWQAIFYLWQAQTRSWCSKLISMSNKPNFRVTKLLSDSYPQRWHFFWDILDCKSIPSCTSPASWGKTDSRKLYLKTFWTVKTFQHCNTGQIVHFT